MSAAKIKKGDKVVILSGKDKGRRGEVTKAMPKEGKIVVGGVNMMTRHKKPSQENPQGGLERIEAPLHVSKVAIEDPKTGKPTRVGFKVLDDGRKVRVAKGSGVQIDG
jgi:large subunit ribosomal protein L24